MKKAFQNSVSFLMAVLVLFSTFSFTVDKHFCGSILVDTAVLSKAKSCGMEMHETSSSEKISSEESSCCSNHQIAVEGQEDLKLSISSFDFDQQTFLASFVYSYNALFKVETEERFIFDDYAPPLIVKDIPVLHETFLI